MRDTTKEFKEALSFLGSHTTLPEGRTVEKLKKVMGVLSPKTILRKLRHTIPSLPSEETIAKAMGGEVVELHDEIDEWLMFWNHCGITLQRDAIVVPKWSEDCGELIVMPEGITAERAYEVCARMNTCEKFKPSGVDDIDLDRVTSSERDAKNGPYAVRTYIWPEEKQRHEYSAKEARENRIKGITLAESLVLITKCAFMGRSFTYDSMIRCDGSRFINGRVPIIFIEKGMVCVGAWDECGRGDELLYGRRVVTTEEGKPGE